MFNPANLANEVFGILRSFDYVVNIFDFDGNRVYEPSDARRFFASPKNITVSIHEDGENSSIKMFLSKSIDISEVSGLISTMRSTASKFGVLFNVRKYERELKPKDLAPNGASDFDAGVSLSSAEAPADDQNTDADADAKPSPEIDFGDHKDHDPEDEKLDRITGEVSSLTKNFKKIMGLLHDKKVKESMTNKNTALNEADDGQTTKLGIVGLDVETSAWDAFKAGKLPLAEKPNLDVSDDEVQQFTDSYKASHDGVSFEHETGVKALQFTRVIEAIKGQAPLLAAAFQNVLDMYVTGSGSATIDAVITKAIDAANASPETTTPDEVGAATPNAEAPATAPAAPAPVAQKVGESVIMTESIREFGRWFDSLSAGKLFEGSYYTDFPHDDRNDSSYDLAYKTTEEDFHPDAFLASHGSDFNWGDDSLDDDDKNIEYDYVKSSLVHYFTTELGNALGDEYPENGDAEKLADHYMPEVIDAMGQQGWTVSVKADNAPETPKVLEDGATCACIDECDCDKGEGDVGTELSTDDVILPSRADDDLSNEVIAHHDGDDMDRIIALARGTQATYSPRTPQP